MDPQGCGGVNLPPPKLGLGGGGAGGGGRKFLQKCVKKTKVLLKNEGKIVIQEKSFALRQATFVEQYDIWCI